MTLQKFVYVSPIVDIFLTEPADILTVSNYGVLNELDWDTIQL